MNVNRSLVDKNGIVTTVDADKVGYQWKIEFTHYRSQTMMPFILFDKLEGTNKSV